MNKPLVSVILAAYNRTQFLAEAIESVLNQSYPNIELIVVDDGSSVDLSKVLRDYSDRISLIRHFENRGLAAAINTGLQKAGGEFIDILSDDDGYAPDKIEKQMDVFEHHPEIDIVYTDYKWLLPDGKFTGHSAKKIAQLQVKRQASDVYAALLSGNFIDAISPLVRRRCYEVAGNYNERLKNLEDWEMWLRLSAAGFTFYYLDEPLIYIRRHQDRKSLDPVRNKHQRLRVLYHVTAGKRGHVKLDTKMRTRAYANVFFDYAYAVYKQKDYSGYCHYMWWALRLHPKRATFKAIRRLLKSILKQSYCDRIKPCANNATRVKRRQ